MNVVALRPRASDVFAHVAYHVDAFPGVPPRPPSAILRARIDSATIADPGREVRDRLAEPRLDGAGQAAVGERRGEVAAPGRAVRGAAEGRCPLARAPGLVRCRIERLGHQKALPSLAGAA